MADPKLNIQTKAALARNTQSFKAGGIIFNEGDTSTELYLLLKGKVEVVKGGKPIAQIGEPMSYFGEMSAILSEPRSATIKAVEDCEFMIVPGDKLDTLIDVSPAIGKKLIQTLALRLSNMNKERLKLNEEVKDAKRRSQEEISSAAQDYKRVLYGIALVYEKHKLPQVAEILKWGKDSSMLAAHAVRMDLDDRYFASSEFMLALHKARAKQ